MDEDGFIFLGYDADMDDEAEFIWRKNYTEPIDSSRAHEETKAEGYGCLSAHRKCRNAVYHCADVILRQDVNTHIHVMSFNGEIVFKYLCGSYRK